MRKPWIPAFAGMTISLRGDDISLRGDDISLRGNDVLIQNRRLKNRDPANPNRHGTSAALLMPMRGPTTIS
jgi:hypothetical protein